MRETFWQTKFEVIEVGGQNEESYETGKTTFKFFTP